MHHLKIWLNVVQIWEACSSWWEMLTKTHSEESIDLKRYERSSLEMRWTDSENRSMLRSTKMRSWNLIFKQKLHWWTSCEIEWSMCPSNNRKLLLEKMMKSINLFERFVGWRREKKSWSSEWMLKTLTCRVIASRSSLVPSLLTAIFQVQRERSVQQEFQN